MKKYLLLTLFFIGFFTSADNIVVNGTRFIYPESEKEITIQISNLADRPAIAQIWLDTGDSTVLPENITTPFQITPPISRVNAKGGQTLRIKLIDKAGIATDRETLWWLNILDIPPVNKEAMKDGKNVLQLAIRSRFKLFYRPTGLGNRDNVTEQLTFSAKDNAIEINNKSPFHITVTAITLSDKKQLIKKSFMLLPKDRTEIPVNRSVKRGDKLFISNINDYGSDLTFNATLE